MPGSDHTTSIEYRDIEGFLGYRVGDDGSVWSCRTGVWRRLNPGRNTSGYFHATLRSTSGRHCFTVHRLILETFVGLRPEGMEACHGNGDRRDNRLVNLRWDTTRSNTEDRDRHGTTVKGGRHKLAKLTEAQIPEIRAMIAGGTGFGRIADRYRVSPSLISKIACGKNWGHLR